VTVIAAKGVALGTHQGEHQLGQLNGARLRSLGSFAEQDVPFILSRPLAPCRMPPRLDFAPHRRYEPRMIVAHGASRRRRRCNGDFPPCAGPR
jgi:phosphonoacetate hydrolase